MINKSQNVWQTAAETFAIVICTLSCIAKKGGDVCVLVSGPLLLLPEESSTAFLPVHRSLLSYVYLPRVDHVMISCHGRQTLLFKQNIRHSTLNYTNIRAIAAQLYDAA